jgi:hypothetical protein
MRNCDDCDRWAQWRGTVKDKDGVPVLVLHLCQIHKELDNTPEIKFIFCGAIPLETTNAS